MPTTARLLACALLPLVLAACATPVRRQQSQPDGAEGHWTDRYIDPVTAPFLFESPLVHTSVRPVGIYHSIPETSVLQGGTLKAYALQARYAVTEDFAIIATKDGYVELDPGLFSEEDGWADIAGGVKGIVIEDEESGTLVTAGLTYEAHAGTKAIFQGNGSGVWRPFISGIVGMEDVNMMFGVGASIPEDSGDESTFVDWHLHASLPNVGALVPLIEVNGIHYTDDGNTFPVSEEAVDYGNLGAVKVDGNDIITAAAGARWRLGGGSDLGFAYEIPVTSRKDIFGYRVMVDWMLRF